MCALLVKQRDSGALLASETACRSPAETRMGLCLRPCVPHPPPVCLSPALYDKAVLQVSGCELDLQRHVPVNTTLTPLPWEGAALLFARLCVTEWGLFLFCVQPMELPQLLL